MGYLPTLTFMVAIIATTVNYSSGYMPGKEHFLSDALLREVVERMGRVADLGDAGDYMDFPGLMSRTNKGLQSEQEDYESILEGSLNPSLRDQEYLQHSSLWGHQYVSGGAGEGPQRLKPDGSARNQQQVKTDTLPAYCNPPNPCPVGYSEDQGCTSRFENTAAFSRDFQSAQRCMCDGEHMFQCPSDRDGGDSEMDGTLVDGEGDMVLRGGMRGADNDLGDFLARTYQHKNLVAKKFHAKKDSNPYLQGEKLPVAAKKGINVNY